jgi:hypothetical protein
MEKIPISLAKSEYFKILFFEINLSNKYYLIFKEEGMTTVNLFFYKLFLVGWGMI